MNYVSIEEIALNRAEWRVMFHIADPICLGHKAFMMIMKMMMNVYMEVV